MIDEPYRSANPAIRELQREIVEASNPQILRIVAAVDAVTNRGEADALISPLRERLIRLQPPRRLRFSRLLFHPLSPLIVPAGRWRPTKPLFPRTALPALATCVRTAMGSAGLAIEAEIDGRTTADIPLINRLGRTLWPAAAAILIMAAPPAGWNETGLTDAYFRSIALAAAALLSQAPVLDTLCTEAEHGLLPSQDAIHAILRSAAAINEAALPMMVSLLLMRLPEAISALQLPYIGAKPAMVKAAIEQAADMLIERFAVDGPEPDIAVGSLAAAGASARRIRLLLTNLATTKRKPPRKAQLDRIRARLDAACKSRFTAGLQNDLLAPLHELAASPQHASLPGLEATARGLRVLETEARAITGERSYDVLLGQAAELLRSPSVAEQLGLADRVRLVEILLGPEAALAMLTEPA